MLTRIDPGRYTRGLMLVALVPLAGCLSPYSDFQGARTMTPGQVELTGSYSSVHFRDDGETDKIQNEFGAQAALGVTDRVEVRAKYFLVRLSGDEPSSVSALAVGPKFALLPGRFAAFVPVGLGFGSDIETSETLQIQPTLLGTIPVSNQFELNPSAKALVWLNADDDTDNLLAFNLGAGFSSDLSRWAIRPEVGIMVNPGEDGTALHFGIGFSGTVGAAR